MVGTCNAKSAACIPFAASVLGSQEVHPGSQATVAEFLSMCVLIPDMRKKCKCKAECSIGVS